MGPTATPADAVRPYFIELYRVKPTKLSFLFLPTPAGLPSIREPRLACCVHCRALHVAGRRRCTCPPRDPGLRPLN